MSIHLHGGFPPWISDGTPFQDFGTPPETATALAPISRPTCGDASPGSYSYYWTNQQRAKFMWYHDHAMDITRLNAYAGLATGYVLTDSDEQNLINTGILPAAGQTIYLVLQDKTFNADGSLWYPYQYEWSGATGRWAFGGSPPATNPEVCPKYLDESLPDSRGLFRHHHYQRLLLPIPHRAAPTLPFPHPQRLPGPRLQPATLLRRPRASEMSGSGW